MGRARVMCGQAEIDWHDQSAPASPSAVVPLSSLPSPRRKRRLLLVSPFSPRLNALLSFREGSAAISPSFTTTADGVVMPASASQ